MTAKQVVDDGLSESFKDSSGRVFSLELQPGLSETELNEFAKRLPGPIPAEIRELLLFSSGFNVASFYRVDFSPKEMFGLEEIFPCGLPMARDECGNEWVLDVRTDTGSWGPVFFVSHDPAVVALQAPGIATFIEQVLDTGRPGRKNLLTHVAEVALDRIWASDPCLLDVHAARSSADGFVSKFSKSLPGTFRVADLRALEIGSGFAWWRRGSSKPTLKRYESELIFGVESQVKDSLLDRLWKRRSQAGHSHKRSPD